MIVFVLGRLDGRRRRGLNIESKLANVKSVVPNSKPLEVTLGSVRRDAECVTIEISFSISGAGVICISLGLVQQKENGSAPNTNRTVSLSMNPNTTN
jgi:hypothetical protein